MNRLNRSENPLWCERYRPATIADCILPTHIQKNFEDYVAKGTMPNLLLSGSQGTGKTTVALALCEQLGYEVLFINGSNEGKLIDTLRTKIATFASTVSLSSDRKCVITDEADFLPEATQAAYRSFMEQFSDTCSFIFTVNFRNRIIEPLHSRFANIEYRIPAEESASIAARFFKRTCFILDTEKVKYDRAVVAQLIKKFFPDWRRVLNELQRYSISGTIDSGILALSEGSETKSLIKFLKEKDFAACKKWVFTNPSLDMVQLCRDLDTALYEHAEPQSIPGSVLIFADYLHKHVTALDPQINCLAMLTEIMMGVQFK